MPSSPMNIMDITDYVQKQGDLGRQQGLEQRFSRLAGQAYTAPAGDARNALMGQAVATDPSRGVQLGNVLASRDASAATAETNHLEKIGGAARYMMQAVQTKNPAAIEGAYQAVRPYLAQLGAQAGKVPPDHYDPSMNAGIQQIIAQTGGMPEEKGVVVSAGGQVVNPMTGAVIARNPYGMKYQNVPTGEGQTAGSFDPNTGQVRPAVGVQPQPQPQQPPQPQADPMQAIIARGNQMVHSGMPQQQVEAWMQQQAQGAGLNPQPAGATDQGQPDPQGMQPQDMPGAAGQPASSLPNAQPPAQFGVGTPRESAGTQDTFTKNKQFADKLQAAGAITTPAEYSQVLTTGKLAQSDADVHLSDADERNAQGLATYAILPASLGRGKTRAAVIARALEINPDYNQAQAKVAYGYLADLGKSGPTSIGGQVVSANTLLEHGGVLLDANNKLTGTGSQTLNKLGNAVAGEFGDTNVTNYNQAVNFYSQELGKLVKGGVANEGEVRDIIRDLAPSRTPDQRHQAILQAMEFLYGRVKSIEDRGVRALGSMAPDTSLLTAASQGILSRAYREAGQTPPTFQPPGDGKSYVRSVRGSQGVQNQPSAAQPASGGWSATRVD